MDTALTMQCPTERRRTTRRSGEALSWVRELRVRPGLEATLVNLSEEGAVIETSTYLRPGARTAIHVVGVSGDWRVSGHVARSWVAAILDERGVLYRGALVFDSRVDLVSSDRDSPGRPGAMSENTGSM